MVATFRRGLFWRVYVTLVVSLVLVAILGAGLMHLIAQPTARIVIAHRPRNGPHMLAMLISVAALVGLAAYPVVARITGRLERLRSSLDDWGGGRLATRAAVEGRDEVAAVAESFNAAADRVEALLAAHKDLLAHASHELRSPLARLRMAVEMYVVGADPALRPSIEGDIAELTAIVDEILLASRLDQVPDLESRERVDCLGLAAEEAARAGAVLRQAEPAEAVFEVEGSPRLLRRMLRNLIENASRHGAPPAEIGLTRVTQGGRNFVQVTVDDEGPGIPEDERGRVFEPFYRPSGRPEAAGGWGLGLSIVRQIAGRHGGTVACVARPGGGGRFIVSLPAAPSAPSAG
ncbi:MAG TPA: HAMP domain-containing sensor histidine kinase [Caulobacteraceae bacterium]|jgi:signal transduction histidine kinase